MQLGIGQRRRGHGHEKCCACRVTSPCRLAAIGYQCFRSRGACFEAYTLCSADSKLVEQFLDERFAFVRLGFVGGAKPSGSSFLFCPFQYHVTLTLFGQLGSVGRTVERRESMRLEAMLVDFKFPRMDVFVHLFGIYPRSLISRPYPRCTDDLLESYDEVGSAKISFSVRQGSATPSHEPPKHSVVELDGCRRLACAGPR